MSDFVSITLGDIVGSGIASSLVGYLLLTRTKTLESKIGLEFDRKLKVFESTRSWREQSLFELLGPIVMQFRRTETAFKRWSKKDLALEAKVIREGNLAIRDLLLAKGHLVPAHLQGDAMELIAHYDAWLLKFDAVRGDGAVPNNESFVFVGPDGYPFPRDAQRRFEDELDAVRGELYGSTVRVSDRALRSERSRQVG